MKVKHLSEKRLTGLLDQLRSLAPELTKQILDDHRNNDSKLYHAIVESACDFYDDYYNAYLNEARNEGLPAIERLTRDQIAANLMDNFEELLRKTEFLLYAAFEDIGKFGILKDSETLFIFAGFPFYGEEMMKRTYENSPDTKIPFYSMITDIDEDIYLPVFHLVFKAIDRLGYDWRYIPKVSSDDMLINFQDIDDLQNYDPEESLLEELAHEEGDSMIQDLDDESRERLARIFEHLFERGFGGKYKETDDLKKYNVPPLVIGYFDHFSRFPDGYTGVA